MFVFESKFKSIKDNNFIDKLNYAFATTIDEQNEEYENSKTWKEREKSRTFSTVVQFAHATKEGTLHSELIFIVCHDFGCIEKQGETERKRTRRRERERDG